MPEALLDAPASPSLLCHSVAATPVSRERVPICHVSMTLATGGLEKLLVEFSRLYDAERFKLKFVALAEVGQPAADIRQNGCDVQHMRLGEVGRWRLVWNLARTFRQCGAQIVHTHNTYAHFYGAIAARLAGVPIVINTQHGRGCGPTRKNRWQFRIANCWTDRVVGVSEDSALLCRRDDRRIAPRVLRIWNGVDLSRFQLRQRTPLSGEIRAISVSRLSPEKDLRTLLDAVAIVVRERPEFRLQIVGDGSERWPLEQRVQELDLPQYVQFLGERSDVPALLAEAGFFVSSSLTEGVSLTLLEAAAVGLPIVATAVGGSPEVVVDGRSGVLVPPANPGELAKAILRMCSERSGWDEMGRAGRTHVEQCFEVGRMVSQYESLYEELLTNAI